MAIRQFHGDEPSQLESHVAPRPLQATETNTGNGCFDVSSTFYGDSAGEMMNSFTLDDMLHYDVSLFSDARMGDFLPLLDHDLLDGGDVSIPGPNPRFSKHNSVVYFVVEPLAENLECVC